MKRNNKKEIRFAHTECKANQLELQGLEIGKSRKIIVKNDGKVNSSDAEFLLLQQVEQKHRIIEKLSDFFTDRRDQEEITHSLGALLKQRIFGICQGYEDLSDHEQLRDDPLLQYICGRMIKLQRQERAPFYVFCDDFPLIARLRLSIVDACVGTEEILVRVEKLFGKSGAAERVFSRFSWKTESSWSRNRDIIAKAEHLPGKKNPRFIVTDIPTEERDAQSLYENVYCARGDMENRIKEQ